MTKKLIRLGLSVITLVLELLPYGAVLNFANPEGEPWRRTFSYFDMTPFGYALFGPLITAILSCIIALLCVASAFNGSKVLNKTSAILSASAFVISLTPLLYGVEYFSSVGCGVSACLLGIFIFSGLLTKDR